MKWEFPNLLIHPAKIKPNYREISSASPSRTQPQRRMMNTTNFTDEQMKIIRTKHTRVECLAYAGCGKSSTLRARIGYLIKNGVPRDQILTLSFSNASVAALKQSDMHGVTVQTFHAFARGLAQGSASTPASLDLISSKQQHKFVRICIKSYKKERIAIEKSASIKLTENITLITAFFSRTNGDRKLESALSNDPESEFCIFKKSVKYLHRMYRLYSKLKQEHGNIEYADMLDLGRKALLDGDSNLQFKYLFVDEAQDMNQQQTELLKVLATKIPNVMVFGDPLQAIYGFAGGQFAPLSSLMENVTTYRLTRSFRLTEPHAAFVSAIVSPLGNNAAIIQGTTEGIRPELLNCPTLRSQTSKVLKTICQISRDNLDATPSITVLARTKAQLRDIEIGLLSKGFQINPLHQPCMADNLDTLLSILRLLEKCARNIESGKTVKKGKLEQHLLKAAKLDTVYVPASTLSACRRMLTKAISVCTLEGRYIVARKVYEKLLRKVGQLTGEIRAELGRWEPLCHSRTSAKQLKAAIQSIRNAAIVTTSTIHKAKGLEFDYVLLISMTEGCLPFYRELKRGDVNEERRLFYVAASRARKQFYLFHAPYHHAPSGGTFKEPSQFLSPAIRAHLDTQR